MTRALGSVRLSSDDSVASFRSGLLSVTRKLGMSAVRSGALSAAISSTARDLLAEGRPSTIGIHWSEAGDPPTLSLVFDNASDRWRTVAKRLGATYQIEPDGITLTHELPRHSAARRVTLDELTRDIQRRSRRALMRELRERNAELADVGVMLQSRVDAQTRDLIEAVERANAANEAKSQFLSSMSHELRTPLNGVLGYAQLLLRSRDISPRHRRNLEAIESCGRHLLRLINDILDLSKIEAGRMELSEDIADLHQLISRVGDIVRPRAESADTTLTLEVDDAVPRAVRTDATKLNQVLVNLLGNAAKFTLQGQIALRVKRDGELIAFSVEDTGVGMSAEELERVFSPFSQGEGTGVRQGTGLGLTISRRLVDAMGGTLDATSTLGVGSTFTVRLPLEEVTSTSAEPVASSGLRGSGDTLTLAPGEVCRTLVVDDNETNRDVLESALSEAGFTVDLANDGQAAVDAVREGDYRLVLMDIQMPVLDGVKATEIIRRDLAVRDLVVVAVTASVPPNFREMIREDLFNDIVAKPFVIEDLLRRVASHTAVQLVTLAASEDRTERMSQSPPSRVDRALVTLAETIAAPLREQLIQAAELSGVEEIDVQLEKLERADARFEPLVTHARELLARYDLDGLVELFGGEL